MARAGINLVLVQQARNALLARGVRPTIDAVRIELGNTGSKSTIQRYLKALSGQLSPTPPPTLLDELHHLLVPVAERLQHAAHDALADERQALSREQQQYRHQRQTQLERLQELQARNAELNQQLSEQRQREHQLLAQQQRSAVELQRLQQAERGQAQLAAAQVEQLRALEDKHRHAREALEHYQVQQQQLRERELQRHEAQLRQVQLELHRTQESLLSKHAEIVDLNRDNERLVGELRALQQQAYAQADELSRQRTALEQCFIASQRERTQLQEALSAAQVADAALRERLRHLLVEYRQQRRQLRDQAQHLTQLNTLLQRVLPGAGNRQDAPH